MNGQRSYDTKLKLCAWNICGLKDKLQNEDILKFILDFDIVWILESKKYFNLQVPGFFIYQNVSREGHHRGGVIMLVKQKYVNYIMEVDTNTEGQIWAILAKKGSSMVKVGGVYIPPEDSPYFNPAEYGALAAHTRDFKSVIVLGDFNSRVGALKCMETLSPMEWALAYWKCASKGAAILSLEQGFFLSRWSQSNSSYFFGRHSTRSKFAFSVGSKQLLLFLWMPLYEVKIYNSFTVTKIIVCSFNHTKI